MVTLDLLRLSDDGHQTLGRLRVLDKHSIIGLNLASLEPPWRHNERNISCVPEGTYSVRRRAATRAIPYEHLIIENVPGRSGICIHAGNVVEHTEGCPLVGLRHTDINADGKTDVASSRLALKLLLQHVTKPTLITVRSVDSDRPAIKPPSEHTNDALAMDLRNTPKPKKPPPVRLHFLTRYGPALRTLGATLLSRIPFINYQAGKRLMSDLVSQPTAAPTRKVRNGGIAGVITTVLIFALQALGFPGTEEMAAELAGALVLIVTSVTAWLTKERKSAVT